MSFSRSHANVIFIVWKRNPKSLLTVTAKSSNWSPQDDFFCFQQRSFSSFLQVLWRWREDTHLKLKRRANHIRLLKALRYSGMEDVAEKHTEISSVDARDGMCHFHAVQLTHIFFFRLAFFESCRYASIDMQSSLLSFMFIYVHSYSLILLMVMHSFLPVLIRCSSIHSVHSSVLLSFVHSSS